MRERLVPKLVLLSGEPAEMAQLQAVLEAAPSYFELVAGGPPGQAAAQSMYTVLPEGTSNDDKFVLGIYLDKAMVGCVDLIRGYPDVRTAMLGLLLVEQPLQGKGVGSAAYREVEEFIGQWACCDRVRLGVVGTNERVMPFWEGLGFVRTGEVKPYRHGAVTSETVMMEKLIQE